MHVKTAQHPFRIGRPVRILTMKVYDDFLQCEREVIGTVVDVRMRYRGGMRFTKADKLYKRMAPLTEHLAAVYVRLENGDICNFPPESLRVFRG